MISKRKTPRRGPARDPKYLDWIRGLACVVCWPGSIGYSLSTTHREAAHVGERGLGQKCSDYETIPLCAQHHRLGKDSHHVLSKAFWAHHGLDKAAIIAELRRLYESR